MRMQQQHHEQQQTEVTSVRRSRRSTAAAARRRCFRSNSVTAAPHYTWREKSRRLIRYSGRRLMIRSLLLYLNQGILLILKFYRRLDVAAGTLLPCCGRFAASYATSRSLGLHWKTAKRYMLLTSYLPPVARGVCARYGQNYLSLCTCIVN